MNSFQVRELSIQLSSTRYFNSRIASPAPLRLASCISEYLRDKNHTRRASAESRQNCFPDALRRTLLLFGLVGDIDINARPDQSLCASDSLERAFGLAVDVISRKPGYEGSDRSCRSLNPITA